MRSASARSSDPTALPVDAAAPFSHSAAPSVLPLSAVARAEPTPPGPVAQLATAFVAMPRPTGGDQPSLLVIRLEPQALGRVQIKVEQVQGGAARVELSVERPDTLALLMQDRSALDEALTRAGLPAEARTVSFTLADPLPDPPPPPVNNTIWSEP